MGCFTDVLRFKSPRTYTYNGITYTDVRTTLTPFKFYLSDTKTGEFMLVPAGTPFNGASIPKIIRIAFKWRAMDLRWLQATVLHDAAVGEFCDPLKTSNGRILSWHEATDWFDAALRVKRANHVSCPPLNRWLFVKAVKAYGYFK